MKEMQFGLLSGLRYVHKSKEAPAIQMSMLLNEYFKRKVEKSYMDCCVIIVKTKAGR